MRDWRGSSTRHLEGSALVSHTPASLIKDLAPWCVIVSENGSAQCRFLSLALSHWRTFIPTDALKSSERFGSSVLKTGVNRGQAFAVRLTAGCRECKQHKKLSATLPTEWMQGLLSRSLVLSPPAATFISWRLEISNSYAHGLWERSTSK